MKSKMGLLLKAMLLWCGLSATLLLAQTYKFDEHAKKITEIVIADQTGLFVKTGSTLCDQTTGLIVNFSSLPTTSDRLPNCITISINADIEQTYKEVMTRFNKVEKLLISKFGKKSVVLFNNDHQPYQNIQGALKVEHRIYKISAQTFVHVSMGHPVSIQPASGMGGGSKN